MEGKTISARLREFHISENPKFEVLADEIKSNSEKDLDEVLKIFRSDNKEEKQKATYLLLTLGEISLPKLADSVEVSDPEQYSLEMEIIAGLHLQRRNKILKSINAMLLDTTMIPSPDVPEDSEEKPPLMRICDKGFLLLRKMTAFEEDGSSLLTNERVFLQGNFKQRDKEIERFKSSKEWISLSDQFFDEGDF